MPSHHMNKKMTLIMVDLIEMTREESNRILEIWSQSLKNANLQTSV